MDRVDEEANEVRFGRNVEVSSRKIVEWVLENLGLGERPELRDALFDIYNQSLLSIKLEIKNGAKEVLSDLRAKGYRLGLISNTAYGEKLRTILKNFSVASYFDVMVFSDEFGLRKPRREIFQAALDQLQIRADEAAHVGDRPDLDVLGAKNAGIVSIYLNENSEPYPEGYPKPDITIHNLSEVTAVVELLIKK